MRKTKLEKGITLVALIITIVVLLILAVVSIGAIRDSKIIGHSKDASSQYTVEQEKEQLQLALSEWQLQKNNPDIATDFESAIKSALDNTKVEITGEKDGPLNIVFKGTQNKYELTANGKIKEKNNNEPISIVGTYGDEDYRCYKFNENGTGYYKDKDGEQDFTYTINDDNTGVMKFESRSDELFILVGTNDNKVILTDYDYGCYYEAYTTNGTKGLTKLDGYSKILNRYDDEGNNIIGTAEIDGDTKTISFYENGKTDSVSTEPIPDNSFILSNLEWNIAGGVFKVNEAIYMCADEEQKNIFQTKCFVVDGEGEIDLFMEGGH